METPDDGCGASERQSLVGQPIADLSVGVLPDDARIIPPDSAVTMDFSPTRLNVDLDEDGNITRLWCG